MMTVREHPWHIRRPSQGHFNWIQQLVFRHQMTVQWIEALNRGQDIAQYQIKRAETPELERKFSLLEKIKPDSLPEEFLDQLDEATPDEFLERLHYTVEAVEGWTLRSILENTKSEENQAVLNVLENVSWRLGRQWAQRIQKKSPETRFPLDWIAESFKGTPFSGYPRRTNLLFLRKTKTEVILEWLHCPHSEKENELGDSAHKLCSLQGHWSRGFVYELNSTARCEIHPRSVSQPRCVQHWRLD